MKRLIRPRPAVADDLSEAADWYNAKRPGLGDDFVDAAYEAFDDLSERPGSFPIVHKGVRRALMRRFPYAIYFRIDSDAIVILVVIHTARSPRVWKRRLP